MHSTEVGQHAGDRRHRPPLRDRELALHARGAQQRRDRRDPGREPGRLAQGRRLLRPDRQHRRSRARSRTSTTTSRATTTTATGSCSPRPRPSTGSTSTQRFNPVVEHFMHQQGATGSRIFVPPWAEPVSPNLDPIAHESGNALGLEIGKYLTADGYKGVQHSMGTQNSYGIMFSADVATYTSWRGASLLLTETADPARPGLHVHERQPARAAGPLDGRPGPVPRQHLDARAGQRVRQGRALRRRALGRPQPRGLAVQHALQTTSKSADLDGRAVGVRAPGRSARPVRGLRAAAHARAGRRRRSSARRRRSPPAARATRRAPTCSRRSSGWAASSTSSSTTRRIRSGRGRARPAR